MSIFAVDAEQNILDRPSLTNKAQKFRLEIRRRQNDQRFKTIRKQFVQSLKSLSFLEELKSQKDNLTAKKINWLIEGLEGGQNNASFYQDMMDMQLEPYLCQVMLNQQISLQNKTKILKSLVQLTYFSCKMPKQFLQNSVIDYFRVQLKKVQLGDEIQQQFVDYLSKLILNLTSFKDIQFNEHMMESDFLPLFRDLFDNRNANRQFNSSLRQTLLKIYSNIYRSNPQSMKSIVETLYRILSDQQNSDNQTRLCCTLKCLVQAAKIPNFWLYLQQRTTENGQIYKQILSLVDIIQTNFTETNFGLLVDFLNALYDQNQRLVTEQTNNYYQQFPKDFFLNAFDMLKKTQQNNQQSRRIICKLVKLLARLPSLQNIAYRTNLQRADMISGIMEKSIVSNSISRKYLARVLSKALEEDSCVIDVLIDNGIIDLLRDLIDSQFFKEEKVDVINLVEKLIQAEQVMRDKTRQQNKMLNVLYDRGIIRDIEKLQDDKNENVYRRAEQFMGRLNEFSQKN